MGTEFLLALLARLFWVPMATASFIALFAPNSWAAYFHSVEARAEIYPFIVGVALISGSGCLWELFLWARTHVKRFIIQYRKGQQSKNLIRHLTKDEKDILKPYIELDVTGLSFPKRSSSTLYSLSNQNLIYLLDENGDVPGPNNEIFPPGVAYSYNLQPWVRQFVKKNPSVLD